MLKNKRPLRRSQEVLRQLRQHDKRLREGVVVLIALHNNATTISVTRLALQQAAMLADKELAIRLGLDLVRELQYCTMVHGASHRVPCLQTTFHTAKEELVIYLHTQLLQPLDD